MKLFLWQWTFPVKDCGTVPAEGEKKTLQKEMANFVLMLLSHMMAEQFFKVAGSSWRWCTVTVRTNEKTVPGTDPEDHETVPEDGEAVPEDGEAVSWRWRNVPEDDGMFLNIVKRFLKMVEPFLCVM